ncbi:MAG: hypothetical protein QM765_11015 [Myxococcales bacterium]
MDGPTYPKPGQQPAPVPGQLPKKKTSGCLIALLVVAIVGIVISCAVGVVVWQAAKSETGQAILGALGDATKLAEKGMNAPGAKEVQALGCTQAVVFDLADVQQVVRHFAKDAGDSEELKGRIITCSVGFAQKAPTCQAVADTYVKALGGRSDSTFTVIIQRQNDRESLCEQAFDEGGAFVPEPAEAEPKAEAEGEDDTSPPPDPQK